MSANSRPRGRTAARVAAALGASTTLLLTLFAAPSAAAPRPQAPPLSLRQATDANLRHLPASTFPAKSQLKVAAEAGPTTWTYNTSGNKYWYTPRVQGKPDKSTWPLRFAIASAANVPVAIGIQETCISQATEFLQWLQLNKNPHYRMHFRAQPLGQCSARSPSGKLVTEPYGIAAFALGDTGPGGKLAEAFRVQEPSDYETRGYACIKSTYGYYACTAHLSSKREPGASGPNGPVQAAQFNHMYDIVDILRAGGHVVYWGGDFYMTPAGIRATGGLTFFSFNREADLCTGHENPTQGGNKVDYAMRTAPAACTQAAVVHKDPAYSDHAMVGGYL